MKVYVDELPKSCEDCCFECDCFCCISNEYIINEYFKHEKHEKCPLQYLADHDKQVRKQVCDEIRELIKDVKFLAHETEMGERLNCLSYYKMLDILLRIEQVEIKR